MTVITGGPLLDSAGEPTNGRLFLEQTARFETATGFVTQARYVARVVNGQILKADSDDPLTIPPTPDTQALRIYEELGGMKLLTRTVTVPDEATVTYAQLQDVAPPAESGSFVVPDWVAGMLAAKDDAVQSASLAASSEATAVNAAVDAENSRAAAVVAQQAAEAVPAQVDAAMASVAADPSSDFAILQSTTFAASFSPLTGITYDAGGNVETVTENGLTTTYTYGADGNVATDSRTVEGVTTVRTYTYDPDGNLTGIEAE